MESVNSIISITSLMILLALFTSGCKKDSSNQYAFNANLKSTEAQVQQSYSVAKTNDDLLKIHVTAGGHFTDPVMLMEDSLYHLNDSLCKKFYLLYCKNMYDGDNMMGGNMMGGNGMMANHTYMGDTAIVNLCFRNLNTMRLGHPAHHPVR
jgi:hypothetical protein